MAMPTAMRRANGLELGEGRPRYCLKPGDGTPEYGLERGDAPEICAGDVALNLAD